MQIDAARRPRTVAMQEKLTSEAGQTAYRKRKWIAEPPNGWIKAVLGFRQFSLRGLEKVRGEFKLCVWRSICVEWQRCQRFE